MRHTDKYEKTEERLIDVINSINELTKDRFIASLYVRNVTDTDVDIRLAEVRRCLGTVHGEALRLAKLGVTYNNDFAVADNKPFTTAERLFNRLRSSMSAIKKELRRSCPIIRKATINPNMRVSVFERSVLTKGCCARDLFDITSYGDNVQALYYEERALFSNVILSLAICYRVIKEEREIKENSQLCLQRLDDQCERILTELEGVIEQIKDIPESEIQKLIDQMGKEEYAQQYFHKPSLEQLKEYAIYTAQRREKEDEWLSDALRIFKNSTLAVKAKIVIAHFDEFWPTNRKMMNALKIRLFCNWCNGGQVDNPLEKFYKVLVNLYKGKHETFPQWHAVITCKTGRNMDAEQARFNEEVCALLEKYKDAA